jgi:predicted RND superfamily exporter protein
MVLAAQYESWSQPLSVILIVPMCLLAAVSGLLLRGMSVDILAQIGFVVLVALASKNAILIVEFAKQSQDEGASVEDAAVRAARTRLRPILMTSLAFILGVVPLAIATGAGAEMRQSLGTAVFFGMLGVTVFGLLFTPTFYTVCSRSPGECRALANTPPAQRWRCRCQKGSVMTSDLRDEVGAFASTNRDVRMPRCSTFAAACATTTSTCTFKSPGLLAGEWA